MSDPKPLRLDVYDVAEMNAFVRALKEKGDELRGVADIAIARAAVAEARAKALEAERDEVRLSADAHQRKSIQYCNRAESAEAEVTKLRRLLHVGVTAGEPVAAAHRPPRPRGEAMSRGSMSLDEKAKLWSDASNLRVSRGRMNSENFGGEMAVSCHHKQAPNGFCGGCAARMYMVLDAVEEQLRAGRTEDALKIIDACSEARRADKKAVKR